MRLASRFLFLAPLALAATSCFEPPVAESLLLEFLPEGVVTVTARIRIRDLDESNVALQRRIEEARRAALEGNDPWSRRFEALGPTIERGQWEKHEGRLVRWDHSATTDDPEALGRFFADTGVAVEWRRDENRNQLTLFPPAAGEASREERQRVSRALGEWSERVATYLDRAGELWRYLEDRPQRDRACFARLFSAYLPEEQVAAAGALSDDESHLIHRLEDAMHEVTSVLEVPPGEAYSLDETSRRVYDPFPAPIEIALPGPAVESEGFRSDSARSGGHVHAGGTSLWQALRSLENRWLTPDPMLTLVAFDLRSDRDRAFDLEAFLGRARQAAAAPDAKQVREALAAALSPATAYRVSWLDPALPEPIEGSERAVPDPPSD